MKKQIAALGVLFILAIAAISCRKESQMIGNSHQPMLREDDDSLKTEIESFYDMVHNGGAEGTISVETSVLLIEAAYNYYAARNDNEHTSNYFTFSVSADISEGEISNTDVAAVFYQIKDSLMQRYEEIDYSDKALGLFDLEAVYEGEEVIYTVKASIFDGDAPDVATEEINDFVFFEDNASHAWSIFGNTNSTLYGGYSNGGGQCDIVSGAATNINGSAPSSPQCLRYLGIINHGPSNQTYLYTNLTTTQAAPGQTAQTSPYGSILGYDYNYDIYRAWAFTNSTCSNTDPWLVYKMWLRTDQMNFYLSAIPNYISANAPLNKSFYDFNIAEMNCLCCWAPNTGINQNPYSVGEWASRYDHWYIYTYGDVTSISKNGVYIPIYNM